MIIGDGPEKILLQKKANKNIRFLGWQPDEVLKDYYRRTRALIFPGEEDFGIVPVEVQACGRFVIAYGKGGALETVADGQTGVFFNQSTTDSLLEAIARFERLECKPATARQNALYFSRDRFKTQLMEYLKDKVLGVATP